MTDDISPESTGGAGRYVALSAHPAIVHGRLVHPVMCEDCGAMVLDQAIHDRFHAIQGDVGRSLAMIVSAHISPGAHALFNVYEKISKGRNRNNWSGEALDEVAVNITSITETNADD